MDVLVEKESAPGAERQRRVLRSTRANARGPPCDLKSIRDNPNFTPPRRVL
jgi:hypothetical protein